MGLCESEMTTTGVPLASKTHATVHRIDIRLGNIETAMQRLNLLPPSMPQVASLSCSHESQIESKLDKVLEVLTAMTSSSAGGQYLHLKAPAPVYFSDLWDQCNDIANEHGMILGSTHQSAGTFYGNVIANNVVKKAFLSPTRAVSIVAACQ